jgi:hypothetical protein
MDQTKMKYGIRHSHAIIVLQCHCDYLRSTVKIFVYIEEKTTSDELKHEIESADTCEAVKEIITNIAWM